MTKSNKSLVKIILAMAVISIAGLIYAWYYYGQINASNDPRVVKANVIYQKYDKCIEREDYSQALILLDSIIDIYEKYPDYINSYEMGVAINNKAAIYLSKALSQNLDIDSMINLAEIELKTCISIYENWEKEFGKISEVEMKKKVVSFYENSTLNASVYDKYIHKRMEDMLIAQRETMRRLSVSYTNLGIVYRNKGQYEKALESYKYALKLWDKNLSAKNNINIILGRPLEERSVIERMFPENR